MRVWRALKATGCGVLRDGVYLLPEKAPTLHAFDEVESQVQAAGGFAMTVDLEFRTSAQREHARNLFDRSGEYGALVESARALKPTMGKLGARKAETAARRLQKSLDDLEALDFFPGEARTQAREAIAALKEDIRRIDGSGEPRSRAGRLKRADPSRYQGRIWASRKDPGIDRLACAWLIKRFIDRDARFAWLEGPRKRPKDSVGFDFDGADFTHVGSRVTFEVLLASFALDGDPALAAIGAAVHYLDAGGIPVADARGIETLIRGVAQNARNDDERVVKAGGVFDHLYAAYSAS